MNTGIKTDQFDFVESMGLGQDIPDRGNGDFGGLVGRVAIDPATDGREGDGFQVIFGRKGQAVAVAGGQP